MTERQYDRELETSPADKRQVYHTTQVQSATAPDGARDVYQEEQVISPAGDRVVRAEHVSVPSEAAVRDANAQRIKQVIYFITGAIAVLLGARFVLLMLGASEASGFVRFIYGLSTPFMLPFVGIFGEPTFGSSVLEWASLVGIIVYLLVGVGLAKLVNVSYAPPKRSYP